MIKWLRLFNKNNYTARLLRDACYVAGHFTHHASRSSFIQLILRNSLKPDWIRPGAPTFGIAHGDTVIGAVKVGQVEGENYITVTGCGY